MTTAPRAATRPERISLVVPVYNEHENIGACLRGLWSALSSTPHEILVCYDFDEDTTLAAIAAMPDAPPTVRLVKNTLGRGAANALRAGFAAATGDVVVTTMADLSDPPQDIPRMAALMRERNLAVVAGSRYVRGGKQIGGPLLKRTLSMLGGVSLRWIAGLGTHDATSNFRAYSGSFLDAVEIESRTGFQIALELTVKAHLAGLGVGEVPTTWTDRTAGESRFRLWKWLPSYLAWWWRAAWQPLTVGLVWLLMTVGACMYVHRYAPSTPFMDDLELVPFLGPDAHWTVRELWGQHNEHRLPLPRALEVWVFDSTRDVRSMMYMEVALMSALALATLLVVRRIRGRTWLVDAVFPLVWLHTGNAENLLMGFSTSFVLPTMFASALILLVATRARLALTSAQAVFAGLCLCAMPLCGGPGLVQVPALLVALIVATSWSWRSSDARARRGFAILCVFLLLAVAIVAVYPIGLRPPEHPARTLDPVRIGAAGLRTATLVFGAAGRSWWPWSGIGVGALVLSTLALLVNTWRSKHAERRRVAALSCALAATACLVLSIGYGRAAAGPVAGFSLRYIPLVSPLAVTTVCAWTLFGGRVGRWLVPGLLALTLLVADVTANVGEGANYGFVRQTCAKEFASDLGSGMRPRELIAKWTGPVYPQQGRFREALGELARLGLAPFDRVPADVRTRWTWTVSSLEPTRTDPDNVVGRRWIDNEWPAWLVPGGTKLYFDVPAAMTRLTGSFGMLDGTIERGNAKGAQARVLASEREGAALHVLFERTIDPVHVAADRGTQAFDVALKPGEHYVVLEMLVPEGAQREARWAYWSDLDFR